MVRRRGDWQNTEQMFWDRTTHDSDGGCWNWTGSIKPPRGYGQLMFRGRNMYAHRLAFELSNGAPIPSGLFVCHTCDNRICINPAHLFLGTAADNNRDARMKGRSSGPSNVGSTNPYSKLSEADVIAIRARYASGSVTQNELARIFGMTQTRISEIVLRKGWTHV